MFEGLDQHEVKLRPDGSITIPRLLLEKVLYQAGNTLLLEQTNDGILITRQVR